jgi:hypothetical protein
VRDRQNLRILFTLCALWMLLFIPLQSAIADVDDVITDNGGINETDPSDGSDESAGGGGDDVPWWEEAWDKVVDVGVDLKDQLGEIGKDISNEWNDFLDSSEQVFSDVSDWFDTKWNEARDWLDTKWNEAGDWLDKNKWAQTLIAAVIATVVIVAVIAGLVALGVVGAISIAVVAVIAVGAIAGGFIYQWIAGDDYSFWGALGSSTVGGILGYLGMASGAFASAWGWLRATAWPAVQGWVRNTAVPWITGKWQAGINWARTVAFPFIRTKFTAGVNFVRTKFTAGMNWMRTVAFPWVRGKVMTGWNGVKGFLQNPLVKWGFVFGSLAGFFSSIATTVRTGEFSVASLLIDTIFGGITGGLTAPFLIGSSISAGTLLGLSLYGGIENTIGEALKTGFNDGWDKVDWFGYESAKNFLLGTVVAGLASKLSPYLQNLGHEVVVDTGAKFFEEWIKNSAGDQIDKLLDENNSNNKTNETTNKKEPSEQKDKENNIKEPDKQGENLEKDKEPNLSTDSKQIQPPMAPIQ